MIRHAIPTPGRTLAASLAVMLLAVPAARGQAPQVVRAVAFSPDGKLLVVGTGEPKESGTVTLWEVASRQRRWTHTEKAGIPAVAFSPDGQTLAVGTYGTAARLLDVATGKVRATFQHPKEVRAVAFAPDGKGLATACWDRRIRVWDLATGKERVACTGHRDRILTVGFSPDGQYLLSAGGDDGAKLWDAATGAERRSFQHYYMPCSHFSPDGRWILTGSYDGTTRLWDAATGAQRARFRGTGGVQQLAYSAAARTLAVCGTGRELNLFDLTLTDPTAADRARVRALLEKLDDDSYAVREATGEELLRLGFVAEAELRRAAKEAKSAEVRIRARRLRQEMLSRPRATLRGHTDEVYSLAFAPDGKLLASAGRDGTVRLWELPAGKEVARLVPAP
jgi:WD40 repeat protein